ncbi:hypothetical protein JB92DRAFT_2830006 [Gautieria morchelliformis]|nr:hypothetical protein JB92DRAFT_2830006 [Gautieria morchelliformis]
MIMIRIMHGGAVGRTRYRPRGRKSHVFVFPEVPSVDTFWLQTYVAGYLLVVQVDSAREWNSSHSLPLYCPWQLLGMRKRYDNGRFNNVPFKGSPTVTHHINLGIISDIIPQKLAGYSSNQPNVKRSLLGDSDQECPSNINSVSGLFSSPGRISITANQFVAKCQLTPRRLCPDSFPTRDIIL